MARYQILPRRSRLEAEAQSTLHPIRLETDGLRGSFEAERRGAHLDLEVVPQAELEIDAGLLQTGNRLYDLELRRRLEIRKYPTIVGKVHRLQRCGAGNRYAIGGELRFHGVIRPLEGEVEVRFADEKTLEVEGEHVIDVRDFGLEVPKLFMLKVEPRVRVRCAIVAEREG